MGQAAIAIVFLLAGAVAGCALAYFITRERVRAQLEPRATAAETHAAAAEALLAAARESAASLEAATADLRSRFEQEQRSRVNAEAELRGGRERLAEERALLNDAQQKLTTVFGDLAGQALRTSTETFLKIAAERFTSVRNDAAGDLEQRKQAVEALVKPLAESLHRFDTQIQGIENARREAYGALRTQVDALLTTQQKLQSETTSLVQALRSPNVKGNWGEMQLRRAVELAGMTNYCDFQEQQSVATEEGRLRPDLIVRLPGGKQMVVDAKAPLKAYVDALGASDEATRATLLSDHARLVRDHIAKLSSKRYWEQFQPTPDFVVLFLPGETFFSAALEQDPTLIEQGVSQGVIVASPTTLIALLRAAAYGWKQEDIAKNAKEISQLAAELYERLRTMAGHFEDVGDKLNAAVRAFNAAVNSMETRVFPSARKFPLLGAAAKKDIAELQPIEAEARGLHARDWTVHVSLAASAEEPASENGQADSSLRSE
jgi:DNA recombination protein RmuC